MLGKSHFELVNRNAWVYEASPFTREPSAGRIAQGRVGQRMYLFH